MCITYISTFSLVVSAMVGNRYEMPALIVDAVHAYYRAVVHFLRRVIDRLLLLDRPLARLPAKINLVSFEIVILLILIKRHLRHLNFFKFCLFLFGQYFCAFFSHLRETFFDLEIKQTFLV